LKTSKKPYGASADKLRANMDAAEYKHLVLGLIFVKYISDAFVARQTELKTRLCDPADELFYGDAADEDITAELEDRDYYTSENVFWVPEGARWEALRAAAPQPDIGKRIDDALSLIEADNPKLKGILDKRFARAQLPDGKLGELVNLISTIGFGDDPSKARDILGQVYEYFLGMFASAEGKRGGQFYTPASIVKTLVAVLSPSKGQIYDPCCGSSGMFVQSEKFIEDHGGKLGDVSIYGQEANPTTWALGGHEPRPMCKPMAPFPWSNWPTRWGVTLQTVRRDVQRLADEGLLARFHGGVRVPSSTIENIAHKQRENLNAEGKIRIARDVAAAVPNDCSLILNIGTTTEAIARALHGHTGLRVITNNLNVASILSANTHSEVIVVGGVVRGWGSGHCWRSGGGLHTPIQGGHCADRHFRHRGRRHPARLRFPRGQGVTDHHCACA
jgi:hypothetical protein